MTSNLIASALVCSIAMALLWVHCHRRNRYGDVDVLWAYATGAVALALIVLDPTGAEGRGWVLALIVSWWSLRLGTHLFVRLRSVGEDSRYLTMSESMGKHAGIGFFIFFQVQALWVVIFALPVWAAARAARATFDLLDVLGIGLALVAIVGEAIADRQLAAFRANPANKGRVCRDGLWRYSRHPNYFFEWLHWCSYPLIGFGSDLWWLAFAGAGLMYVFLNYVTGIPHAEREALSRRGEAYALYQAGTNRFFPWLPKLDDHTRGDVRADDSPPGNPTSNDAIGPLQ
jgi:steroid 5-alpha reductase family enzyme